MAVTFDPPPIPLARNPVTTRVFKHDGKGSYTLLPLVLCLSVRQVEGADPGSARFRYILDDADPSSPYPNQFEQFYPLDASSKYVVRQDDRLAVKAWDDSGRSFVIFDGFAQVPEIGLTPDSQEVSFLALGVAVRLWDLPAEGAVYRDASDPDAGANTVTGLPVRFNPTDKDNRSLPNATPTGKDAVNKDGKIQPAPGGSNGEFPVFLEENLARDPSPCTTWTLGRAVRYLLWRNNAAETYVSNGDTTGLDSQLMAITAAKDGTPIDPTNPATFNADPIVLRDYDVGNRPAIEAIADLLEYNGFATRFGIETSRSSASDDGTTLDVPKTTFKVYRKDGLFGDAPLDLKLAQPGVIDPGKFNVGSLSLRRDTRAVANAYVVETGRRRFEVSLILAPGWTPAVGDETSTNRQKYVAGNWVESTTQATREAYRKYIYDECGDGHWDRNTSAWVKTPGDFDSILNIKPDGTKAGDGERYYARRYRPALGQLLRKLPTDRVLDAQLHFSRDFIPQNSCIPWDGKGTWQVIDGGWSLLKDQLGILVTCEDPEAWAIGDYKGSSPQNAGKHLRGVTSWANPYVGGDANRKLSNGRFSLRLTCVIEADFGIEATADRRATSPTKFTVRNRIDARDNFLKEVVDKSSAYQVANAKPRDDTKDATAYANALRAAREVAPSSGTAVIPRFTDAYPVGCRIRSIAGRDCSLRSNAGAQQGERPQYPTVTAIEWTLSPQQSTTLTLTDRIHDPQRV